MCKVAGWWRRRINSDQSDERCKGAPPPRFRGEVHVTFQPQPSRQCKFPGGIQAKGVILGRARCSSRAPKRFRLGASLIRGHVAEKFFPTLTWRKCECFLHNFPHYCGENVAILSMFLHIIVEGGSACSPSLLQPHPRSMYAYALNIFVCPALNNASGLKVRCPDFNDHILMCFPLV